MYLVCLKVCLKVCLYFASGRSVPPLANRSNTEIVPYIARLARVVVLHMTTIHMRTRAGLSRIDGVAEERKSGG
jgi:hypothetical protein